MKIYPTKAAAESALERVALDLEEDEDFGGKALKLLNGKIVIALYTVAGGWVLGVRTQHFSWSWRDMRILQRELRRIETALDYEAHT